MNRTKVEVEYKIYHFLNDLKIKNPEIYKKVKKILKYLYKIVDDDYFKKTMHDYLINDDEYRARNVSYISKKLFNKYVNGDNAILDNLIKMCQNDEETFIYFYDKIEPVLEMIEEGLCYEYGEYKYVFNLYAMLKVYELHPDDYGIFSTITDELSNFFISSILNFRETLTPFLPNPPFEDKQDIIDLILSNNYLKDKSKLRELLKQVLDDINYHFDGKLLYEYKTIINNLDYLYQKEIELIEEGFIVLPETISKIEDEILSSIIRKDVEAEEEITTYIYYEDKIDYNVPLLLIGNRYQYFKNKMDEVEDSDAIKKDILTYIKDFNFEFFHHLDLTTPNDSFIACMYVVFDSDTYLEVKNKLDYLIKIGSRNYTSITLPDMIEELNRPKRKEVIDGITMTWLDQDTMNKVEKPKKIIDRMIKVHHLIKDAPPESFYHELCAKSNYQEVTLETCSKEIINKIDDTRKNRQEIELKRQEEMAMLNQAVFNQKKVKQKTLSNGFFNRKK